MIGALEGLILFYLKSQILWHSAVVTDNCICKVACIGALYFPLVSDYPLRTFYYIDTPSFVNACNLTRDLHTFSPCPISNN